MITVSRIVESIMLSNSLRDGRGRHGLREHGKLSIIQTLFWLGKLLAFFLDEAHKTLKFSTWNLVMI